MYLTIIVIGDEILIGQVTDTNSGNISRRLGPMGWQTIETVVVGDDPDRIRPAVERALEQSDLVITTGGLGPTKDDITKRVLTGIFGGEMRYDSSVARNIERIFAARSLPLNQLTRDQAYVPTSCRVIQNELGTAPIMWFERDGRVLIAMPGVPHEAVGMMDRSVTDEIRRHYEPDKTLMHHTLIVSGISESALAQRLAAWEESLPTSLHLAYLPVPGYIRLRLDGVGDKDGDIEASFVSALDALRRLVSDLLMHDGDATPAEILLEMLRGRGLTVSTAESCTGGNIAHKITSVAGSSDCFMGSVVSYANSVKTGVLGVDAADLAAHGAVSEPVVSQMAQGACRVLGTDCSIATSGVAGPGGGTPDKPVGTVWMSVSVCGRTVTRLAHFAGDRARVIDRATSEAILMLVKELR